MPNPNSKKYKKHSSESANKSEFMKDCIPMVHKEDKSRSNGQCAAICYAMWNKRDKPKTKKKPRVTLCLKHMLEQ